MLKTKVIEQHGLYDLEDVTLQWESEAFEVDGVWYLPEQRMRNPNGSRFFTLRPNDRYHGNYADRVDKDDTIAEMGVLFDDSAWQWFSMGDEYWDNRRSP